jgi:hypothetical protein
LKAKHPKKNRQYTKAVYNYGTFLKIRIYSMLLIDVLYKESELAELQLKKVVN